MGLRQRAGELVYDAAVFERLDRRNTGDAILHRRLRVLIDVELRQPDLSGEFHRNLLDRRAEDAARTAPWRPEVDHDRRGARRLDHVALKRLVGYVQYCLS